MKYVATQGTGRINYRKGAQLASERNVSMTEIALAWLLTKVTSPVAGATKLHHVEGAASAAEFTLGEEEINYLEEAYVTHRLAGVMAQNTAAPKAEKPVWPAGGSSCGNARGREKECRRGLTKEKEQRLMIDNIYWIYISK